MLEVIFTIYNYDLNIIDDDDLYDDVLDVIAKRYDYILFHSHGNDCQIFKIKLDKGYDENVALVDILSDLKRHSTVKNFYFKLSFPRCIQQS